MTPLLPRPVRRIVLATVLFGAGCFTPALHAGESAPPATLPRLMAARDFGVVPDGPAECGEAFRALLRHAIEAGGETEIVLEPGTYRVQPASRGAACLPVTGATNLVIRGAGRSTKIVVLDPAATGFSFGACQRVALCRLAIDYDPVPFCQGTVRTVEVEAGWFELDVEEGYPTPDARQFVEALEPYGKWGMIMDRETRRIRSGTPDHYMTPRWEDRGGRVWRFYTADEHHRRNLAHLRSGDAYVHLARGHGSAVFAQGCDGFRVEDVTIHASPGLAVGLVANRGDIVVRGLEVRFVPGTTRLLTTNADGVHAQQNRAGPVIEHCYFEGMADDAINLYAPPLVVREVRSPTEWLVSGGVPVLPGDALQVLEPRTGSVRGTVRAVTATRAAGGVLLAVDPPLAGVVAGGDHRSGDTLYNLSACGAGFRIRRNHMNGNRRYGCLLRAGGGLVEDNTFADTTGAGVVLANEPDWPEGPVPWGIAIRGNRFLRGGTCLGYADSLHGAALALQAMRLGHGLAEGAGIRDVVIEHNEFVDRAGVAVFLGGVTNVVFRQNRIAAVASAELRREGAAILVERSAGVTLQGNRIVDPRPGTTAAVEIGPDVAPGGNGVRVEGLEAVLGGNAVAVRDRRAPE